MGYQTQRPIPANSATSSRLPWHRRRHRHRHCAIDMLPPAGGADFLIIEFIAGNRRIPNGVYGSLLAALAPPSGFPGTSQRLRQALVLSTLDGAVRTEGSGTACSGSRLLHRAREVLADPDVAACFPHKISVEGNDEAMAAAAVADLRRLLDLEWANLPPSTLQRAAESVAGDGSHQTWATTDQTKRTGLLVGESTEREILAKLMQDGFVSDPPILPKVTDNVSNANEADGAGRDDEVPSSDETSEADAGQEGMAGHQNASVRGAEGHAGQEGMAGHHQNAPVEGAEGQVSEKSAHASEKGNLMGRNPNASTYEWDDSDDDQTAWKRKLPSFERKLYPSTCAYKIRKKWSEIEEKTLLEGVEKYGKGSWTAIKLAYPNVFEERSTVDLKDKFRNLERRHHESA